MVEIIGVFTIGALVWLIASGMATESDAEKRRVIMSSGHGIDPAFTEVFHRNRRITQEAMR